MTAKSKVKREIKWFTSCIIKKIRPEKIILFGSYAYGRPSRDSDVDLFVIKNTKKRLIQIRIEIDRLLSDRTLPLDVVVRTPSDVQKRLHLGDSFTKEVMAQGKILYEK